MKSACALTVASLLSVAALAAGDRKATTTFRIEGMTCDGCASAVELQLGQTEGVKGYGVSFEDAEARVSYDPERTTPEKIAASIGLTGFRAFVKAGPPKKTNDQELADVALDRLSTSPPHDPSCDKECCRSRLPQDPKAAAQLTVLSESLAPLVSDFNAARGKRRFLAILSPTCSACVHGGEAVREALLRDGSAPSLEIFVVWAPMLHGDDEAAAKASSALVNDARVRQYYDPERRAGAAFRNDVYPEAVADMRRSLPQGHFLAQPFASRDAAQPEWDIYLFFGPGAEWTAKSPLPARFLRQVVLLDSSFSPGEPAAAVAKRSSVLWKNDYAQAPLQGSLVEELRREAAALLEH